MTGTELATRSAETVNAAGLNLTQRVAQTPWMLRIEEHPSWETLAQLRVTIRTGVLMNRFKVRDLLNMKEGQVFESLSPATEDVPVRAGQVQLGWGEFEVLEQRMALRFTRLE